MPNNPLKYSNCWEDAYRLGEHLAIDTRARVLSVASAGDNSLYLLRFNPASMLCIDVNAVQLYLTELKEQAIRHLSHQACLEVLGFAASEEREAIYARISGFLSAEAQAFFAQQPLLLRQGIVHQGKFERYFQLFAKRVLPLIHGSDTTRALLAPKSAKAQAAFYQKHWDTWRWRLLFNLFFSRFVMGNMGREPEKLKYVQGSVSEQIYARAARHLRHSSCQTNYILAYALTGNYQWQLPPYVAPEAFAAIKAWLQRNTITYALQPLETALAQQPSCNRFNLSNIFEYMDEATFLRQVHALATYAAPDSLIAYWQLLVPRAIQHARWRALPVHGEDLGFFYHAFNLYTTC